MYVCVFIFEPLNGLILGNIAPVFIPTPKVCV